MGVQKRTRKFAVTKKIIGMSDISLQNLVLKLCRPTRCPTVCDNAPRHPSTAHILILSFRKKNQMAGEVEAKKKEEESKAKREMYVSKTAPTGSLCHVASHN